MVYKNHQLDNLIIEAAKDEFLENGFQKATLRQIAQRANISTGALYTRYENKDVLFCSLIQDVLHELDDRLIVINSNFEKAKQTNNPANILEAIKENEKIYLDLMYHYYDQCILFFCRSNDSTAEKMLEKLMKRNAQTAINYLKSIAGKNNATNIDGVELIIYGQFNGYRMILQKGLRKETAISYLKTAELFLEAGWEKIFETIMK